MKGIAALRRISARRGEADARMSFIAGLGAEEYYRKGSGSLFVREVEENKAHRASSDTGIRNPILFYVSLTAIIVSVASRKQPIGGWLIYFYYWIAAVLYISLQDIVLHPSAFNLNNSGIANQGAFFLAVFPRLFAYLGVAVTAAMLLMKKEWIWVERLRIAILAGVLVAGISVLLDVRFFPNSIRSHVARWVGLCLWLFYFHVSKRVRHVFQTKDWAAARQLESAK